jgi:hypothetical protein
MPHTECFALSADIESRAFSRYYVAYESKAKEAATVARLSTQIQKTNPAAAEKLKAFLTTKAIDESKVGFLPLYGTTSPQRRHNRRPRQTNRQNPRDCACISVSSRRKTVP